jgi:hypothetical protein
MARACFDPFAAIRMWEKLQALQKNLQGFCLFVLCGVYNFYI